MPVGRRKLVLEFLHMALASHAPSGAVEAPKLCCSSPFMVDRLLPVPCGQCHACRVAAKRRVVFRARVEREAHADACCATLTYSDEFVGDGNVRRVEWKRVKDRLARQFYKDTGVRLRFFGIGEYGGRGRPHWHVVAFGMPLALGERYWRQAWTDPETGRSMGFVSVGEAGCAAMEYIAGYCVKKLTRQGDRMLGDRAAEFVVRPNRPGLGLGGAEVVGKTICGNAGALAAVQASGDVPGHVRMGGATVSLDKVFRNKLRQVVVGDDQAELVRLARAADYRRQCVRGSWQWGEAWGSGEPASDKQRVRQREARSRIYASRRSL